jgi:dihydropyrimidinase
MDLIVRNGIVVTAADTFRADVGIERGRIVQIGAALTPDAGARAIDAAGCYVIPGGIDVHTHLDTPAGPVTTCDDYVSGTIAAACGGTTTIVDFCQQDRGQTLRDAIATWHAKSEGRSAIDYGFHCIVVDPTEGVFDELLQLPDLGVTSFKLFMAYKHLVQVDDLTLLRVLARAKEVGALVMVHAENGDAAYFLQQELLRAGNTEPKFHAPSRPPRVEAEATARAIALAELVGAPLYVVHVSCGEAIEEIERGRARKVAVLAETCPQYLFVDQTDLDRPDFQGAKYVFTPPARPKPNQERLWRALADDTLQLVSSDHSAWRFGDQKSRGHGDFTKIPNGAPGIEERMTMVYQGVHEGRLTPSRFVELTATAPAKIFGLYPKKGTIAVGSDADLVIWDPNLQRTISQTNLHHRVDYTIYEGKAVHGGPKLALLRGEVIAENGEFTGRSGFGEFIARARYGQNLTPASADTEINSRAL